MELLPIDIKYIFKTLFFAMYGIVIFKIANYGIKDWISEEGGGGKAIKNLQNVKFRLAFYVLYLILVLVGAIFLSAVITFWFSIVSGNFLNLTIVTSIIVISMIFWEFIKAINQSRKIK